MSTYYYFAASLPLLHFYAAQPPMSHDSFLESCGRLVSPRDLEIIGNAVLKSPGGDFRVSGTLVKWQRIENGIRNELIRARARRLDLDPARFLHSAAEHSSWTPRVHEIVDESSPLDAEMHLLRLFWEILDDLGAVHQFDLDFLIVYALKLQILQRKAFFDKQSGHQKLMSILQGQTS